MEVGIMIKKWWIIIGIVWSILAIATIIVFYIDLGEYGYLKSGLISVLGIFTAAIGIYWRLKSFPGAKW